MENGNSTIFQMLYLFIYTRMFQAWKSIVFLRFVAGRHAASTTSRIFLVASSVRLSCDKVSRGTDSLETRVSEVDDIWERLQLKGRRGGGGREGSKRASWKLVVVARGIPSRNTHGLFTRINVRNLKYTRGPCVLGV